MVSIKNKILHQLLWEGKNSWQMFGALAGSFLGILLLLLALQFYQDIQLLVDGGGKSEDRYVMINKRVNLFNTLGVSAAFTDKEIAELQNHPTVNDLAVFTSNQFRVSASSALLGFYTELFFESLPDEFIDYKGEDWKWEKGDKEVPIVLSRDYLALYNFGFAPSQGLPQFTPNTIRRVSFDLKLEGRGNPQTYTGRIVGFSDRINSVLVPLAFMEYANATLGGREKAKAARLILDCENIYDPNLEQFLKSNQYELSRGRFIGGQVGKVLKGFLGFLSFIGLIILLLSLLVFLLNFQLLIAQSARDIRYLLQQGYPILLIRQTLHRRLIWMYAGVLLAALLAMRMGRGVLSANIEKQGFHLPAKLHWSVWFTALLIGVILFYLNYANIRKRVRELFEE